MKKIFLVSALLVTAVFTATACGGRDPDKAAERVGKHMDHVAEDLELTADQRARYTSFRAEVQNAVKARVGERKTYKEFMKSELGKDDPDMTAVTGRIKSRSADNQRGLDRSLTSFNEFYATLNPDQQQRVRKYVKHFVRRYGRHH